MAMDTDDLLSRVLDVLHDAAAADGVLPSEPALADQLGVSRPNLREVLARLQAQGLVLRRRGSETVVNAAALDLVARFDQTFDYADLLSALGHDAQVDVLAADLVPLGADAADVFGRPAGTTALRTVKRWRADGRPAMVAVNLVPMPDGTTSVPPDVTTSVFEYAAEVGCEPVVWTIARPGAIALDARQAAWLDRPVGDAVLTVEQIGLGRSGRALFTSAEHHRPGVVPFALVRIVPPRDARPT
jgi:DNA-binding GntR family transcriptional regulator